MDEDQILKEIGVGEDTDWEFKSAKGGLPGSVWETYSAMANTDGGVIVLGVKQKGDFFEVQGLANPAKMQTDFWSAVNNRQQVNANILRNDDAKLIEVDGRPVLAIRVPRATRQQRPIYVGQNPLEGTYRRNYEGDFKCRQEEVGRMLADQAEEPWDSTVLPEFSFSDLDQESIDHYRERVRARRSDHPWLRLKAPEFLRKIGAFRKDRSSGEEGVTIAGLLMFGTDEAIRDPLAVPQFQLDYRERLSDDPAIRWTDRLTMDGTWTCNVFEFHERVLGRLTRDIPIPFRMEPTLFRSDETVVHGAVREALTNALVHADYRGQGGVVIERYRDRFELSNPGTLLLSIEQIYEGGVSECRNKTLQQMFVLSGSGERAGSGWDTIRKGWKVQNWRAPRIEEKLEPDRVHVALPMVSLLPQETLDALEERFGQRIQGLQPIEVQALATAAIEKHVSNQRMQQLSEEHPTEITRTLQSLTSRGFLEQQGQKRGTTYVLLGHLTHSGGADLTHSAGDLTHSGLLDLSQNDGTPQRTAPDLTHIPSAELEALQQIAEPAVQKKRLSPEATRRIILDLCDGRYLTPVQIAHLISRSIRGLRERFLYPMAEEGQLRRLHEDQPNHPEQAYITEGTQNDEQGAC